MDRPRNPVREAYVFLGLTLGLSYLVFWGPLALLQVETVNFVTKGTGPAWAIALFIAGGFVPSLAGVALEAVYGGRQGLRRLGRRVVQFRIGWRWYIAVLGVVAAATAAQILILRLLGNSFDLGLFGAQAGSFIPLIVLGPLSEEIGWRGFALDRLQTRWNALASSVIVGIVWAMWHLPLFYMAGTSQRVLGIPFVGFAASLVAGSVLYTWFHNNTSGSVWTAIFFHWVYTCAAQVTATGAHRTVLYNYLEYLPYVLAAIAVAVVFGSDSLSRVPGARQEARERVSLGQVDTPEDAAVR